MCDLADHCTLAGATGSATADSHAIIASTRLLVVAPPQGHKFIATQIQTLPGHPPLEFDDMHTRGVNDQGFAYVWSGVPPNPKHEPDFREAYGIPFPQFGRLLLSKAASVADAIALLESNPRAIHGNFLLAFRLDGLIPGEYVTVNGRLTPLAVRSLARSGALASTVPQPA